MIYNYGSNTKQWLMPDGQTVLCAFKTFGIFWLFKTAHKKRWFMGDGNGHNMLEVKRADVEAHYGDEAPNLSIWSRFGLFIGLALILGGVPLLLTLTSS